VSPQADLDDGFFKHSLVLSQAFLYLKHMFQKESYFHTATIHQWKPLIKEFTLEPVITQPLSYLHKYYYSSCKFYERGINDFDFLNDYRDWCRLQLRCIYLCHKDLSE